MNIKQLERIARIRFARVCIDAARRAWLHGARGNARTWLAVASLTLGVRS